MSILIRSAHIRSEVFLLYAARGVRGLADGFAVIILPAYLSAIGLSPAEIGVVATTALLGSSLLTLTVGFMAPRHDLRTMLLLGAVLMVATGIAFPQDR
jgi:MFS family permease